MANAGNSFLELQRSQKANKLARFRTLPKRTVASHLSFHTKNLQCAATVHRAANAFSNNAAASMSSSAGTEGGGGGATKLKHVIAVPAAGTDSDASSGSPASAAKSELGSESPRPRHGRTCAGIALLQAAQAVFSNAIQ